jgi:hypothetical protein
MAPCSDPALTYLNNLGYNVVRLPRTGIEPLDVLGRDGKSLERLGRLEQVWTSTAAVPAPGPAGSAAAIKGQRTDGLNLSVGLKILSSALGAMGAVVPELGFAYNRARKIQFSFGDVETLGVDPLAVGAYLGAGDLASTNPFVARYFTDGDAEAYVITEVLRSGTVIVSATTESGASVSVDVPAIAGAVGGKVSVGTTGTGSNDLTFTGVPVVFGFKAFGIAHVGGSWQVHGVKPGGNVAFGVQAGAGGAGAPGEVALVASGKTVSPVVFGPQLLSLR